MNPMQQIRIEKLTLNIGAGKEPEVLKKGVKLLKNLTSTEPVKTFTQKRIPGWGLRPGLPIGCKVTLRKEAAKEMLRRLLDARGNKLIPSQFDNNGSISFGVPEYIDIKGAKYDPEIGIMGLEASITLERPGFRIKRRVRQKKKLPMRVRIKKEDAIAYLQKEFSVIVEEAEQ